MHWPAEFPQLVSSGSPAFTASVSNEPHCGWKSVSLYSTVVFHFNMNCSYFDFLIPGCSTGICLFNDKVTVQPVATTTGTFKIFNVIIIIIVINMHDRQYSTNKASLLYRLPLSTWRDYEWVSAFHFNLIFLNQLRSWFSVSVSVWWNLQKKESLDVNLQLIQLWRQLFIKMAASANHPTQKWL